MRDSGVLEISTETSRNKGVDGVKYTGLLGLDKIGLSIDVIVLAIVTLAYCCHDAKQ